MTLSSQHQIQSTTPPTPALSTDGPREQIPPDGCVLYGHAWERTEHPDVKVCALCHVRGACPGCTPRIPTGAQPFFCTAHTLQYHEAEEAR